MSVEPLVAPFAGAARRGRGHRLYAESGPTGSLLKDVFAHSIPKNEIISYGLLRRLTAEWCTAEPRLNGGGEFAVRRTDRGGIRVQVAARRLVALSVKRCQR
jgi:hypothetical protein